MRETGYLIPSGLEEAAAQVEAYLESWLGDRTLPPNLREAIRYAVLGPGKRLRPFLVLQCCTIVGGRVEEALPPAAAVEMIHAFSLVHDDLPALDNDDLRRGRPTLHRHAGEALALLAGDALLGLSVELLLERLKPELAVPVATELIRGCNRMIVGQVYDTVPTSDEGGNALEQLRRTHANKTGALILAACRAGALCGGADERALAGITAFGEAVGLMFQVVDDLLDITGTTEELGKATGKDAQRQKLTYPGLLGVEASRREVLRLQAAAREALGRLGPAAQPLSDLCDYLAVRTR